MKSCAGAHKAEPCGLGGPRGHPAGGEPGRHIKAGEFGVPVAELAAAAKGRRTAPCIDGAAGC